MAFQGKSYEASHSSIFKYATDHSIRLTPIQKRLMEITLQQPMGGMVAAPEVTHFLESLIRHMKMKNIIEVGVFTGYSTLAFASSIPEDGKVVACDVNSDYAAIGRPFWKEAGIDHKIDLRIKPAGQTLDELLAKGLAGTFDLAFIDADKQNYDLYFEKCLQLIRQGGIIALDNVLWDGSVLEENPSRPGAAEIKALNDKLVKDERVDVTLLVIGDGLTVAFKR